MPFDLTDDEVESFRRDLAAPIREAVREVATLDDPADIERSGFELAGTLALAPPRIAAEMLEMIAGETHGERLLDGMAVAASPPIADMAATALGRTQHIGLVANRAFLIDAGEAVTSLFVAAGRPDAAGIQIFVLTLEQAETGGAVKDGFASTIVGTDELTRMVQRAAESGLEPREIDPADAVELVVAGARRCVEHGAGPTEDATLAVNLLVRAAGVDDTEELLAALPALPTFVGAEQGTEDPDDADAEIDEMAAALEEWCDDDDLSAGWAELVLNAGVAMAQFRAGYCGGVYTPWTADDMAEFLLDYVPRKVDVAGDDLERFPVAVSSVFRFLSDTGVVPARAALALAATAIKMTEEFAEAAGDPANFGPAKALVTAMGRDGVDVGDRAAVDTWIGEWNALPIEERRRLPMALPEPAPEVVHAGRAATAKRTAARRAARKARRRNRRGGR